jgi:hypothetical protein
VHASGIVGISTGKLWSHSPRVVVSRELGVENGSTAEVLWPKHLICRNRMKDGAARHFPSKPRLLQQGHPMSPSSHFFQPTIHAGRQRQLDLRRSARKNRDIVHVCEVPVSHAVVHVKGLASIRDVIASPELNYRQPRVPRWLPTASTCRRTSELVLPARAMIRRGCRASRTSVHWPRKNRNSSSGKRSLVVLWEASC